MESETRSLGDVRPSLVINRDVFQKVMFWIDKADTEVSGLGAIEIIDGVPTVVDAILIDQECTGTETELDPQAICKAVYEYEKAGKPGEIRWWWHSHVNMDVFWSGTDYAAIEQLGENGWFLSTVLNKRRELRTAFFGTTPMKLFVDEIKTTIHQQIPDELMASWSMEFNNKVKKPQPVSYLYTLTHPVAKDYEVTTVVPVTSQEEESNYWAEKYYLVTTGLLPKMVKEIDDLRTQGWRDEDIAEYYEINERLVDRTELQDDMDEQEIEHLRQKGVPETDIYELMKISRGSNAI